MALTADQLSDFQKDLGIGTSQNILTDAELNRLYARGSSSYDLAVAYAFRQILNSAAKRHDYAMGDTRRSESQVFEHLKEMYSFWLREAGGGLAPLVAGTIELDLIEPDGTGSEYA